MDRRGFWIFGLVLACGVSASSLAADAPAREHHGLMVRHDVTDRGKQMRELHQALRAAEPAGGVGAALTVTLSSAEKASAEPQREGRYRVGVAKAVGLDLDFSRGALPLGVRELRKDGEITWSGVVRSPGASALRLHFSPFDLPEGAELYVYGPERQAFGPYTGRGPIDDGELWTNTVWGEEVRLQLRFPAGVAPVRLVLADLGYMGTSFPRALTTYASFCSGNAPCVVNAACVTDSPIEDAKNAVAEMMFVSGGWYYLCTGGLMNDSDPNSTVPYFLTANHCISRSSEASSLETYFHYQTTCSGPNCTAPSDQTPPVSPDTLGAFIKSTNRTGDYTLLQLSDEPSGNVYYLDWNTDAVAYNNGAPLYRISHPEGSPQAYSSHLVDIDAPTCRSWPRGNWIYSRDDVGATEPGSSGSPVLDANGKVVGQLSGACGYNVNDSCDSVNNATVDGAFASYFEQVAPFLAGTGPQCKSAGETCSMNTQCCSNACKGKGGAKTCR